MTGPGTPPGAQAETAQTPPQSETPGTTPSDPSRPPRGWASLYALAFVLMMLAAGSLALDVRGFLASTRLLWVSTGLSAAAIIVAIVSVVLPRRR